MAWLEPDRLAGEQWAVSRKICESPVAAGLQCQAPGIVVKGKGCAEERPEQRGDVIMSVLQGDSG